VLGGRCVVRKGRKVQKEEVWFWGSIKKPLDSKVVNISNEGKPGDWAGPVKAAGHTPTPHQKEISAREGRRFYLKESGERGFYNNNKRKSRRKKE
jgi:hypothetical protein